MTTILIKKKDTAGAPAPGDLTNAAGGAEIAVNTSDLKIYTKNSGGAIVQVGSGPSATDTLTNKSISGSANTITNVSLTTSVTGTLPVANGGTGITSFGAGVATFLGTPSSANLAAAVTDETGSGALVFATSPTLVTPALGTPASGVVTNLTGTASININGTVGATTANTGAFTTLSTTGALTYGGVTLSNSVTGTGSMVLQTSPSLTTPALGTPTAGVLSACTVDGTDAVGFRNTPINSQSADYTLVLADSGKTIFHPAADNNARTFTIPANSSVAYAVGTVVSFINLAAADVTIAITTDTMYLGGDGATGSRTLAEYGIASALKVSSTDWVISGNGLT
jgi:hypothetical protein